MADCFDLCALCAWDHINPVLIHDVQRRDYASHIRVFVETIEVCNKCQCGTDACHFCPYIVLENPCWLFSQNWRLAHSWSYPELKSTGQHRWLMNTHDMLWTLLQRMKSQVACTQQKRLCFLGAAWWLCYIEGVQYNKSMQTHASSLTCLPRFKICRLFAPTRTLLHTYNRHDPWSWSWSSSSSSASSSSSSSPSHHHIITSSHHDHHHIKICHPLRTICWLG